MPLHAVACRASPVALQVETVLCRILTLALSHGGGAQCAETLVLTPGDQFEVDQPRSTSLLLYPLVVLVMTPKALMLCNGT